jgi:hypothetical protein
LLAYYKHLPHGVIINLSKHPNLKAITPAPSCYLLYDLAYLNPDP